MLDMLTKKNTDKKEKRWNEGKLAKILVIDDDADLREVLFDILTQEGYKTTVASNGKEAIAASQKEFFDLSLIDIKLPDVDGTSLLKILGKLCPTMIKIVVTGYPSLENAVQSLNSGADGYIIKPFKPERILEQIREQLEKHQISSWENLLKNSGLSAYEAKIYLSLAINGASEARKLSQSSGVPRNKAYSALKKLAQRGIVIEVPGAKQKFSIATPSDSFSVFVQGRKQALSEQEKDLVEFETAISTLDLIHTNQEKVASESLQKQIVWSISGEEEITQRIAEMLSAAKISICATTTEPELVRFYKNFRKTLDDLSERNIKIRINVPIGSSNSNFINELKTEYQIENSLEKSPVFFLVVDDRELLVAIIGNDQPESNPAKQLGLFAQSESMISFFNTMLNVKKTGQK